MSENKIEEIMEELLKTERVFLHDISNHLVVSQGMAAFTLKRLKKELEDQEDKKILRLEKSINATNKIIEMVRLRRSFIQSFQKN